MAKRATVTVTKGKEKGRKVVLEPSTCKVIGRRIDLGSLGNDQTVIVKDRLDLREDEILKIVDMAVEEVRREEKENAH